MLRSPYRTLLEPLRARAAQSPDWGGIVLLHENGDRETIPAGELWAEIEATASRLRAAGLRRGDVVLLIIGHSRELIATFFAAMHAGLVPTMASGVTPRLDLELYRRRIDTLVRTSRAAAVLVRAADATPGAEILSGLTCPILDVAALGAADGQETAAEIEPDDVAFIQYSSGSGGVQKGVVHTHAGVLRYIASKQLGHPFSAADTVVCWTPLYHDQGLVSGLLTPLVIGFRSVLISPHHWVRQPGILLQAMHEYGGTVCYMPNFALNHCVRAVRESDAAKWNLSGWQLLLLGGEPVRADSLRAFTERFAAQGFRATSLRAGYGMAEMVEGVTTCRSGPPRVDWVDVAALQGDGRAAPVPPQSAGATSFVSCGPPKDGAELRIVDESGRPLPERRVGEIEVRCEYRMREYHNRGDLTRASFRGDWFRSRDRGYLVDGEVYVVGRTSDMIIVGGRKLAAEDVEAVAEAVPGVLPGRSVAFGVADERSGTERVILVCESAFPRDGERNIEIERGVRRALTNALEATLGELRFVSRGWIVKTSSGKKARGANREKYQREFAAGAERSSP